MTIPHLMNCSHSCDGWCLDCVKELQRDQERIDFLATCNRGWPCVESIDHRHAGGASDLYLHIAETMPTEWEPSGIPVDAIHMQEAFRSMVDEAINESHAFGQEQQENEQL